MTLAEEGACSTVCLVAKMIPKHTKLFKAVTRHVDSCKIAQQADPHRKGVDTSGHGFFDTLGNDGALSQHFPVCCTLASIKS